MRIASFPAVAAILIAAPAAAQLHPLVDSPASAAAARDGVSVFLLNEGSQAVRGEGPAEIEVVARDGARLTLVAAPDEMTMVAPGGFTKVLYRLAAMTPAPATVAAIPSTPAVVPAREARRETVVVGSARASGFFDRFSPHEPVYGAFGLDDAGGKLQLSFAFRALGSDGGPRLNLAYTQTLFWRLADPSGPITPVTYSPEVFVDLPAGRNLVAGAGYRHDSNGEGPTSSIDVNRLFARATRSFDLGSDWRAEVTPMAWFYVGRQGVAPDLNRYWGYTSLGLAVGRRNGFRMSGTLRGNPGTGKGAGELFVSYPMTAIGLPGIYLFAQGFTGYGEALSRYDRRDSHVRLGMAFTR